MWKVSRETAAAPGWLAGMAPKLGSSTLKKDMELPGLGVETREIKLHFGPKISTVSGKC